MIGRRENVLDGRIQRARTAEHGQHFAGAISGRIQPHPSDDVDPREARFAFGFIVRADAIQVEIARVLGRCRRDVVVHGDKWQARFLATCIDVVECRCGADQDRIDGSRE